MHKRFVFNIVARILLTVCFIMLIPLAWAIQADFHSREVLAFAITILAGIFLSCFFLLIFRIKKIDYSRVNAKDGLAIVGLSWILLSAMGALPLYWAGTTLNYTDAFFEIVSGYTTTGATIFSDVESLPQGILFWRSLTHWLGGMGIIVLYLALLPALGQNAFQLYKAEAPGITVEKIQPRIKETAKILWGVYFFLSVLETALLMKGGLSFYDALCHTFGTMATGGFSTQNQSVAAYSPYIQWVITVFMFLAGANFMLHLSVFRGRVFDYFKSEEFRAYFLIVALLVPFFAFGLHFLSLSASPLRDASFQVISILTTTGYTTTDFNLWPVYLQFMLVLLMFIGGCGGSTGGGLKVVRVFLSIKYAFRSVVQAVYPNAVVPIKYDAKPVPNSVLNGVVAYFLIFIFLFFLGTAFIATIESCDLTTAIGASIATLSNIGPGLGDVGATQNFGWMTDQSKWLLIFLMLAGRLELYSILILFLPAAWRK